jgi:hypothetical protein
LEIIDLQLSKCKNSSSPGVSGVSYKMLKLIFKNDPNFLLEVINDVVNDNVKDCDIFSEMVVIPI